MHHFTPVEIGTLLLREANKLKERLAVISIPPVGSADPDPIIDGFANRAIGLPAVAQFLFETLALRDIGFYRQNRRRLPRLVAMQRPHAGNDDLGPVPPLLAQLAFPASGGKETPAYFFKRFREL